MVTTRESLQKPEEVVDSYLDLGFKDIQLKFVDKIGFAEEDWETLGYSAEEFIEFWKKAMKHIIKRNKEGKSRIN